MLTISRERSILIKGVVILMMVWLHLFNGSRTDQCDCLLYACGEPVAKWLTNACGPVGFFLLLSGYGLAYTYDKGRLSLYGQARRLFRLYFHYWVVLAVFVSVGYIVAAEHYPGSWSNMLLNFSGWEYTYNGEMWFLLPYCLVAISSPVLFKTLDRLGNVITLLITAILYVIMCYCISRHGSQYLYGNMLLYRPVLFLQFLYPFSVGAVFYRMRTKLYSGLRSEVVMLFIVLLVGIVSILGNALTYMVYVPLLVYLLSQLTFPKWLEAVLTELGRKSMVIWMVHTWYCYYLFQPQVYSLRYPLVIMGGVILASYLTAIPVMWVSKKCLEYLRI